jgi:hypothetical protein
MNRSSFLSLVAGAGLVAAFSFIRPSQDSEPKPQNFDYIFDSLVDAGYSMPAGVESNLREQRMIVVTTDINALTARRVVEELLLMERESPGQPIDLFLRTEGGWEADAFSIIDVMKSITSPVNVHGMGEVHSSGSMILAAGTGRRTVYPYTLLGYHTASDDEEAPFLDRYDRFWRDHARLPEKWLKRRDDEMIYFDSAEAVKMRVADSITEVPANEKSAHHAEPHDGEPHERAMH